MHSIIKTSLIAFSLIAAAPIAANATGFESTVESPLSGPIKVEVRLSEDLAYRANNLPKKRSKRGSSGHRNSPFAQNGYYGEKDLARLTQRLETHILAQMEKRGVSTSPNAATVLRVTLTDAKPNRPTFNQLSREVGLSFQSFSIGGAEMEAEIISAGGDSLGTMNYDWYEDDIRDAKYNGTWTDAHRSIQRFAKHAAKNLANGPRS